MSQSGLDTGWVLELLTELEQASEQPYLNFLAQAGDRAGLKEIHPWDILYLVEREMALPPSLFPPERILPLFRRLTSELGFDHRAQELDIRIQDIPYNALTFVVSVPKVVYVISNPSPSYRYYRILFHKFGHALAARYNEQPNYLYKWEEVPFSTHTAPFLTRNLYAPASSIGWRERIERATGKAPSWKAMIASFCHVLS